MTVAATSLTTGADKPVIVIFFKFFAIISSGGTMTSVSGFQYFCTQKRFSETKYAKVVHIRKGGSKKGRSLLIEDFSLRIILNLPRTKQLSSPCLIYCSVLFHCLNNGATKYERCQFQLQQPVYLTF